MNFDAELRHLRAESASVNLAAMREVERQTIARQSQAALRAAAEAQLRPYGMRFVQWAKRARIKPSTITTRVKRRLLGGSSLVPDVVGWELESREVVEGNSLSERSRIHLVVLPTGDICWIGSCSTTPAISPERVWLLITRYIAEHAPHMPW